MLGWSTHLFLRTEKVLKVLIQYSLSFKVSDLMNKVQMICLRGT